MGAHNTPHTQRAGGGEHPSGTQQRGGGGGPGWDEDVEHGGNVSYSRCWASRSHACDAEGLQHRVPARGTRPIRARGTESPPGRAQLLGRGCQPPVPLQSRVRRAPGSRSPPAPAPCSSSGYRHREHRGRHRGLWLLSFGRFQPLILTNPFLARTQGGPPRGLHKDRGVPEHPGCVPSPSPQVTAPAAPAGARGG